MSWTKCDQMPIDELVKLLPQRPACDPRVSVECLVELGGRLWIPMSQVERHGAEEETGTIMLAALEEETGTESFLLVPRPRYLASTLRDQGQLLIQSR
jgi:hypothetical protein